MTRFVVDASAVLHLASAGIEVPGEHELLAPTLLRSQTLSALHEAVQRGEIPADVARDRLARIGRMRIRLLGDAVLRRPAWDLADQLGWASTYNAEYVALTQLQADAFVTLDAELARSVEGIVATASIDALRQGRAQEPRRVAGVFETIEAGGVTSRVYVAGDAGPGTPGVVVFHPWWGLNDDVVAYVGRVAAAGFAVVAPDLFGGQVASTIEEADRLSGAVDEAAVDATALAAVDHLVDRLGPTARVAALGFSLGAAWSMWSPAQRDRLVASVVYYGSAAGPSLSRASVPVLGHFAETDPYEPDEAVAASEATLRSAGPDVVIHRYPGTGHWFAEPSRDAYRAAAADLAFERSVAILRRHLGTPPG